MAMETAYVIVRASTAKGFNGYALGSTDFLFHTLEAAKNRIDTIAENCRKYYTEDLDCEIESEWHRPGISYRVAYWNKMYDKHWMESYSIEKGFFLDGES